MTTSAASPAPAARGAGPEGDPDGGCGQHPAEGPPAKRLTAKFPGKYASERARLSPERPLMELNLCLIMAALNQRITMGAISQGHAFQ